ncbi:MAG: DNA repair protein RecN [Ferruginibacter sp.]|nr:DNA repair protein RecN [Ferruginibacter sp.]
MLSKLHIQNYAIIDDLQISFSGNLNIITGETGAGKSILMGALNLVLGQRADSSVLQQQDKKCVVESWFSIKKNSQVNDFFLANDLDHEDEIMIRREIAVNGKSRSFINDTPVNLSQLKALSILLVDLHQQFDTLELNTENFQRDVLDAFAENGKLLQELKGQFEKYSRAKNELEALQVQQNNSSKELDYNRFLFDELEDLALKENELENLDAEIKLLSNAENVKQQLSAVYFELKDSEEPVVQQLKSLMHKMRSLHEYHPDMEALSKRIQSAVIDIQDVADELERIDDSVSFDQQRIELINERLSAGYKLLKKHQVNNTADLLLIQVDLQQKLEAVLNISASIEKQEAATKQLYAECNKTAAIISSRRGAQVKSFGAKVNELLMQVGMPNAQLKVQLQTTALSQNGIDEIGFLFDANKSNRFEPVSKVASGGELSRLMLSIKSLVARKLELPTLIFDEIDTGISGEAAKQVGLIMKDLSVEHQLIAITHQPQIAARATAHYFVYKEIKGDKIVTSIRLLDNDERITVIAKMLSGEKPTAAALENAREMVRN